MRVIAAILAAAVVSFVLAGALSSDSFPLWLNVLLQLAAFLVATLIADRIAPRHAMLAVAVGLGPWAVVAAWMLALGTAHASSVIVLGYVLASVVLAFLLDRRRRPESLREGD